MSQLVQEVFSGRINTPYHHLSPFVEERARYLAHLLAQGWARSTVIGMACKLVAFATRVDITAEGGISPQPIAAAADDWMQKPRSYHQAIGPHKSRTAFIYAATGWLQFLGRFRQPDPAPAPFAHLVTDFTTFLDHERGLSASTIKIRRDHVLAFLAWFAQRQCPFSEVGVEDVVNRGQASQPAHDPTHDGDASVASGRRHQHDPRLARPCFVEHDQPLCRHRPGDEGEGAGQM